MSSTARMGMPAVTLPRMGTWAAFSLPSMRMDLLWPAWRLMYPNRSKVRRWAWTVEVDRSPVAAQISRTVGGMPLGASWRRKS